LFSFIFFFPAKVLFLCAPLLNEISVEITDLLVFLSEELLHEAFGLWMLVMHLAIFVNVELTLEVPAGRQFFSAKVRLLNVIKLHLGDVLHLQKSALLRDLRLTHLEQLFHHFVFLLLERARSIDHEAQLLLCESVFRVLQRFEGDL